jgi:hypothetical protein
MLEGYGTARSRMGMIEAEPDYDPYSMAAARTRRRYPRRMPDPRALAASQGAVGFSDLPGYEDARQQSMLAAKGEDYNPSSLLQMATGMVGAPGAVGGVPGMGSGVRRVRGMARAPLPAETAPPAPAIVRSEMERPLFDYSRMSEVPDRPQFDLPRIEPKRGVPEYATRLADPANMERVNQIVEMGLKHGGREWYNTMPLLQRYTGELGPTQGPQNWESYLKYVGATSPRTPVPANVSIASYYDMLAKQGLPFPTPVKVGTNWSLPAGQLPEGYGSLAQATNAQNAAMIREQGGWPAWTMFDKPKPPSFTANLMGNYQPITSDVHNISMMDMRNAQGERLIMPPHQTYGFVEKLQQGPQGAQKLGIAPAQYQAAGWIPWAAGYREVGPGGVTGGSAKKLQRYSDPFIKVVEDRVKKKAKELGLTAEETLRRFLRKDIAIAGVPLAAASVLRRRQDDDDQQDR